MSLEAEKALLGAMIIAPEQIDNIIGELRISEFGYEINKKVYSAVIKLSTEGKNIDLSSVIHECGTDYTVYISELLDRTDPASVPQYIEYIKDTHLRNVVQKSLRSTLATFEDNDTSSIVSSVESLAAHLSRKVTPSETVHVFEGITLAIDNIEESSKTGAPTGFTKIDDCLLGLRPRKLIVISGRPGEGKTTLAVNWMVANAKNGFGAAIFSFEMDLEELSKRIISAESEVPFKSIRKNKLTDDDWTKISRSTAKLKDLPIYIDDSVDVGLFEVISKIKRVVREHGVQVVYIDYLQLMTKSSDAGTRAGEISNIMRDLKLLAKELKICIVIMSQIGRGVEKGEERRRPNMSDLKGSGGIEENADIIIMFYNTGRLTRSSNVIIEAMIVKHRSGETPNIKLLFKETIVKFIDYV
jgi:replicative DNA helicase